VVTVVDPKGAVVINWGRSPGARMAEVASAPVIFSRSTRPPRPSPTTSPEVGRAAFVRDGSLILSEGGQDSALIHLHRVKPTRSGRVAFQVENVLAASSAAWALGIDREVIAEALGSFDSDADQVPGRFNTFEHQGATVIVDYAHNPSALEALSLSPWNPSPQAVGPWSTPPREIAETSTSFARVKSSAMASTG